MARIEEFCKKEGLMSKRPKNWARTTEKTTIPALNKAIRLRAKSNQSIAPELKKEIAISE